MKNKFKTIILIVFFVFIFIIFYKGLNNSNIYTPKTDIKKEIPIFKAKSLNSMNVLSSSKIFKKKEYYLVNIWSSWCVPCKAEHKLLMRLKKNNNLILIGINYKDNLKNANFFLDQLGNPYSEILNDKDGMISILWSAYGVPETFLVYNREIIKRYIGPLNEISLNEIEGIIQ